ncbi:5'-AMP-activated protein kinase subunit beta-1 [Oratosquilla oratoria]|uniref:5'-AMP-activated protein kinase subunit beta-1 n=1 Tax=Oratosquilla oratoria TaxID=337810 RepID=UPI003F77804D
MGNHQSSGERRDRHKSGDAYPACSPGRLDGQAFTFDKHKHKQLIMQTSEEEHEPVFCKGPKSPTDGKEGDENVPQLKPHPLLQQGNKKVLPVVLKWIGGGKEVCIAGTFNQWQSVPMVKSEDNFVAIVDLPQGKHEYKFLVDGEWKFNENEGTTESGLGTRNNVVTVEAKDFEEFENDLLKDPEDKKEMYSSSRNQTSQKQIGDDKDYSQEIPEHQQWEKMKGPPMLPPHLHQVILNKDIPVSCEPNLLPEPNHVMLNHMYALSIRDGMMVLSTTHRHHKKYITTLIYRPI